MEPRSYTPEEIRKELLQYMRNIAKYWSEVEGKSDLEKCEGVAFSILNIFDGTSALPAMDIMMSPHENDKDYYIDCGENWYEPGMIINDCSLHEEWCGMNKKEK